MEGTDVADAEGGTYQNENGAREYAVSLKLTKEGKKKFAEATEANVGKQIAIVYDNAVLSAPTVQEAITGGQAEINGMDGVEEAQNLASYIRIGSLSLELEELRSSVVAAAAGRRSDHYKCSCRSNRSCDRDPVYDLCIQNPRSGGSNRFDPLYCDRADHSECF